MCRFKHYPRQKARMTGLRLVKIMWSNTVRHTGTLNITVSGNSHI